MQFNIFVFTFCLQKFDRQSHWGPSRITGDHSRSNRGRSPMNLFFQRNKNEHTEHHDIFIKFRIQLSSNQENHIFLLFGSWSLVLYLHVWVKLKFFRLLLPDNLIVDVQHLHENGKWNSCVSAGVYTMSKKSFLLLSIVL